MGRPSLQKQRQAEVLDAFLTCVAAYGVEGATLERIATEAGLKRPLIRHHLGNRDDMVRALAAHVTETLTVQSEELRHALQDYPGIRSFVDVLFSTDGTTDRRFNTAYQSLIDSVERYPDLRDDLLEVMQAFYTLGYDVVRAANSDASKRDCETVAHGIINLYLTTDALAPLNPPADWGYSSYFAALRLAESIDPPD